MKKLTTLLISIFIFFTLNAQDVGLIVNEFSNGLSGTSEEYIELLVVGCPSTSSLNAGSLDTRDTSKVDLRSWIIDDNNGAFSDGASAGEGIAQGHIRFANIPAWQSIPVGAIIVIYDSQNPPSNTNFPSDDFTDTNGDLRYVLPLDADDDPMGVGTYFFEYNADVPTTASGSYVGGSYTTPPVNAWNAISLRNDGDAVQTREPNTDFFHGVAYGDLSGTGATSLPVGTQGVKVAGGGSNTIVFLSNGTDGDYRDNTNYTVGTVPTNETAGNFNNLPNSNLINNFRTPSFAGDDMIVCSLTTPLAANGVAATWTNANMWTFAPTGLWTVEQCPVGVVPCDATNVSFTFPTSPTSQVSVLSVGTYKFRWTQNTGGCQDADEVFITFIATPSASATDNLSFCGLMGSLDADPFPDPPASSAGVWSVVNTPAGAGTPVFDDTTDPNSQVTVDTEGDYEFRWTIGAAGCSDDVTITATFVQTPIATVGPGQNICGLSATLSGNTDFSGQWTYTGPGTATFGNASQGNSSVTVDVTGTYTFTWTVGAPGCEAIATLDITFTEQPTVDADTNTDPNAFDVCGNSTTLAGSPLASGTTGEWTSSPAGVTFSNPSSPTSTATIPDPPGFGSVSYTLTWTNTVATLASCNDADNVEVTFYELPEADADINTDPNELSFCGINNKQLQASTPASGIMGTWSVVPSTTTGVSFASVNDPNTTVSVTEAAGFGSATYTFRWTLSVTSLAGCEDFDDVEVTFYEPPTANASTDTEICNALSAVLNGNTVAGQTGEWSLVSAPAGSTTVTFDGSTTSTNANASVVVDTPGSYTFQWTLQNGPDAINCSNSDNVVYQFLDPEATIDADQDTQACGNTVSLSANTLTGSQMGTWTATPSAGVTFSPNANDPNATATVPSISGSGTTYNFVWTVSEGSISCTDNDNINITFFETPTPDAGPDVSNICGSNPYTLTLSGNAPPNANITGTWSYVSGPDSSPTFSPNANDPNAQVSVDATGTYVLRWTFTLTDSGTEVCAITDDVQVQFIDIPTIDAGDDQLDICGVSFPASTTLSATTSPSTSGAWSVVSSPSGSVVNFTDNTNPNTNVSFDAVGDYVLRWTAGAAIDATCETSDDITIRVTPALLSSASPIPPVCGLTTNLIGSNTPTPIQETGQWTASPSAGVVFADATSRETSVTVPSGGDYTFTWTVGQGACQNPGTVTVNFSDPIINPRAEDIRIFQGFEGQLEVLFDNPVPPNPTFSWAPTTGLSNPNIGNPVASPTETTTYTVTINSGISCQEIIQVTVNVFVDLRVPNVFTPNGDGVNDTWNIILLDTFRDSIVKVYNRWGNLVFESEGYTIPWDGTYNGKKVPVGTYYYVIDPKRPQNQDPTPKKGSVTITY